MPETPDASATEGADAVARCEANAWSTFAQFSLTDGAELVDTPTRLVVRTPVPQPPYNVVLRFADEGDRPLAEQVEQVWSDFARRGVSGAWLVGPSSAPDLTRVLAAHGLSRVEVLHGMVRGMDDLPEPPDPPPGVEVSEATPDDAEDWVRLASWRYGLEPAVSPLLRGLSRRGVGTVVRIWFARVNGRAVSKAVLHVSDRTAGVFGVVTTPEGRGQGLASLLTLTALRAARDEGATLAALQATPMARALYARLGFRDVADFEVWAAPDAMSL